MIWSFTEWPYYSEAILAEDLEWLRPAGYMIHEFDCRGWKTENDFHDDVAKENFGFGLNT
jgi:hypothetical protein